MIPSVEHGARLALVALLVIGCYLVLRPFLGAMLFAMVLAIATWPIFEYLKRMMKGRGGLAAMSLVLLLCLLMLVPIALIAMKLTHAAPGVAERIVQTYEAGGLEAPDWLAGVPVVGESLYAAWETLLGASADDLARMAKPFLQPAANLLKGAGVAIGTGLVEMSLAVFIVFFLYRDGEAILGWLGDALDRLAGEVGRGVIGIVGSTVTGVTYGIVGTAAAQAIVALVGFLIAGVPLPVLLAAGVFFLSIVPMGPPLIWGGAAAWLAYQGESGWAIFMVLWGALLISSIDNFVKPYLISRGSSLPLLLIVLGVFGGIIAFGFIGIFIGPPLLAVAHALALQWIKPRAPVASAEN
jgi:predicted PurR-regulated permease PerM